MFRDQDTHQISRPRKIFNMVGAALVACAATVTVLGGLYLWHSLGKKTEILLEQKCAISSAPWHCPK